MFDWLPANEGWMLSLSLLALWLFVGVLVVRRRRERKRAKRRRQEGAASPDTRPTLADLRRELGDDD